MVKGAITSASDAASTETPGYSEAAGSKRHFSFQKSCLSLTKNKWRMFLEIDRFLARTLLLCISNAFQISH